MSVRYRKFLIADSWPCINQLILGNCQLSYLRGFNLQRHTLKNFFVTQNMYGAQVTFHLKKCLALVLLLLQFPNSFCMYQSKHCTLKHTECAKSKHIFFAIASLHNPNQHIKGPLTVTRPNLSFFLAFYIFKYSQYKYIVAIFIANSSFYLSLCTINFHFPLSNHFPLPQRP